MILQALVRVATKLEIELAREIEQKEAQRILSKSKLLRMEMDQKSDNLQYNTLGRWDKRLVDQVHC